MIAEAIDVALRIGWALFAWIAVFAFVGTVVLLSGLACGTWAVKRAWRALSGPCGASDAPEVAPDVHDAPEALSARTEPRAAPHSPSWAHTDKEAA